jgi:hypothetical protein
MDPQRASQLPPDVESLDRISKRMREGDSPSRRQIEETLERGFGKLMQLEAELQKRKRASAGTTDSQAEADMADLQQAIGELEEALNLLRRVSRPGGAQWIGYGFVLPSPHKPSPPTNGG